MKWSRKLEYTIILAWYYTFIVVYSLQIGFLDILASTFMITLVSYLWMVYTTSRMGAYAVMSYRDLVTNVFVYAFVSFYIAGMTLIFSGIPVTPIRTMLLVSPITVWMVIWTDFYSLRIQGKI
jgi:hypothetical protein